MAQDPTTQTPAGTETVSSTAEEDAFPLLPTPAPLDSIRTSAFAMPPAHDPDAAEPASPLSPLRTPSSRAMLQRESAPVWGWLEPGSKMLSVVLLQRGGVTVGRGREVFDSKRSTIRLASLRTIEPSSPARRR
jgi:hypothetical protein